MMKYSFIIPVYNCRMYLPACIASIRAADLPDYEILLIDDGSTDGSGELCEELAICNPEIRVIHQENAGVSAARNKGILNAYGEYILFVDADDTLRPFDQLTRQYINDGIDMLIYGMEFCYYHNNISVKNTVSAIESMIVGDVKEIASNFDTLYYSNYFTPVWNKIIKRDVLIEAAICFDEELTNYEDLAFSLYTISKCKKIAAIPNVHYVYRVDYDHDRTVDRIGAISNIVENTDLVAKAFIEFENAAILSGIKNTKEIGESLVGIYFELFAVKMKTIAFSQIKQCCSDFKSSGYLRQYLDISMLSKGQKRWYQWIREENALAIYSYTKYKQCRHYCARNIKRLIGRV